MEFFDIYWLLLLWLAAPWCWWLLRRRRKEEPSMLVSSVSALRSLPATRRVRLMWMPHVLRLLAFVLAVIALARPQSDLGWGTRHSEGIDIMLALDVSTSMLALDLEPNRMEAAKNVASEFVMSRPDDNIGLTVFAGETFTQCPMTTDRATLINALNMTRTDIAASGLIEDGTAIGMGLSNCISRLKDSKAKSRVVILLTDGSNNRGEISPLTAADMAKGLGIRVYTIAVGSDGKVRYPVNVGGMTQYMSIDGQFDTKVLEQIARITDGKFYRATNTEELYGIYGEIDKLEKSRIHSKKFARAYDNFQVPLFLALLLLITSVVLDMTKLRRNP